MPRPPQMHAGTQNASFRMVFFKGSETVDVEVRVVNRKGEKPEEFREAMRDALARTLTGVVGAEIIPFGAR